MDARLSLRERKKVEVREKLVAAARRLARARGFDAVTVEGIAAHATVSRRSFFRYFANKESALLERRREQLAQFRALLAVEAPSYETIRAACLTLAEDYVAKRAQILEERRIVARSAALSARDRELDREFDLAMEQALGGSRRARICAAAVSAAVRVVLDDWAASGGELDLVAVGAEALALVAPLAPTATHGRGRS